MTEEQMKLCQGSGMFPRLRGLCVLSEGCHSKSGASSTSALRYHPAALIKKKPHTPARASQCRPASSPVDLCDPTSSPAGPQLHPHPISATVASFLFLHQPGPFLLLSKHFLFPECSAPGCLLIYISTVSLQSSCLGNPMDRGAWWATGHGVAKESDTT